ncbi:unnamed protein product [Angiostrongylus costaricensis]|uniref:G_PROTEIN_RECEP_F2_4 domain-containing protein n=1 Tax=Angiostrongylus costaricensis TaxID=334426 RepID=A0A158PHL4_ANGCS|nr:unnamed protein product [Angiostrongylus costaricensis]
MGAHIFGFKVVNAIDSVADWPTDDKSVTVDSTSVFSNIRSSWPMRHQPMFIVHRHLLTSFLLAGLFYLFNCFFYIVDGAPGDRLIFANHISCRLLFLIQLRFLRLVTFSWMLAEGVYLFRLLQSDSADGDRLTIYKLLCWGVPAVISVAYGILRESLDNEGCWVSPSVNAWIESTIIIPCILALCVNVVLMSWILYILVNKLRHDPHLERIQYKTGMVDNDEINGLSRTRSRILSSTPICMGSDYVKEEKTVS